jgi:hypothetical protein
MLRFLSGLAVLLLALALELLFASAGWYVTLALAVLIAFASIFDFWELLLFDLFAVLAINWQPAPSISIVAFALIPVAAYFFRITISSEPWIEVLAAIVVGFTIFYFISAPSNFLSDLPRFLLDVFVCAGAAELVLTAMV